MGDTSNFLAPMAASYSLAVRTFSSLCIFVVLSWFALLYTKQFAGLMLPLFEIVISCIPLPYHLVDVSLVAPKSELLFALKATTSESRSLSNGILPPDLPIQSSTLASHALQPLAVFYALFALLPFPSYRELLKALLTSFPILILTLCLDTPMVLLGACEDLVLANLEPESLSHSWSVQWMNLMNGGGRLALPLLAIALTYAVLLKTSDQAIGTETNPMDEGDQSSAIKHQG